MMETIAKRYAESLFELALEEEHLYVYKKQFDVVIDSFKGDSSILDFFTHVKVEDEDKKKVIDEAFKGKIDDYLCNFLKLLIDNHRISYIYDIHDFFVVMCNDYLGIEEGFVYSSYELDKEQVKSIQNAIMEKTNKAIKLTPIIDESLIGGVKVELKNHVLDNSLKNKIEVLRKELLGK